MILRHFRRKVREPQEIDETLSSSDEEIHNDIKEPSKRSPVELAPPTVADQVHNRSKATNSQSDDGQDHKESHDDEKDYNESSSDEESTSSSSDQELVLHRPVYLKRNTVTNSEPDVNKKQRVADTNKEDQRHADLLERIDLANEIARKQEELLSEMLGDYTTDKDLLRRTLLLDDSDAINPDVERKEWERRNEERLKRQRDILVAKQMELEEQEARRLKYSGSKYLEDDTVLFEKGQEKTSLGKATKSCVAHSKKEYRPQVVQEIQFGDLPTVPSSKNDQKNEYSIL